MGMSTSAYHFYGMHVPQGQWTLGHISAEMDMIDRVIKAVKQDAPDVCHISAGDYDRDMLFLAIDEEDVSSEVKLGQFRLVTDQNVQNPWWNDQLATVAHAMGYESGCTGEPGWITVPDVS